MKLEVEYVKIEALIPYARNAKKHDDAQVARLSVLKAYGPEEGCRIVISEMLP